MWRRHTRTRNSPSAVKRCVGGQAWNRRAKPAFSAAFQTGVLRGVAPLVRDLPIQHKLRKDTKHADVICSRHGLSAECSRTNGRVTARVIALNFHQEIPGEVMPELRFLQSAAPTILDCLSIRESDLSWPKPPVLSAFGSMRPAQAGVNQPLLLQIQAKINKPGDPLMWNLNI